MSMNRREFVKVSAMAGAGVLLARNMAWAYSWSPGLQKFLTPLQGLGPSEIPALTPDYTTYGAGVDYYHVQLAAYRQQLHPNLPASGTRLYGYADASVASPNHRHLGGVIVATPGQPVRIKLSNRLPATHILPFDVTIPMPGSARQDRAAIHLHGGLVPWASDGGPFHWVSNPLNPGGAQVGSSLVGAGWLPDVAGNPTYDYWYPNNQSARLMWYHDHAIGITRTNAYAGAATGYLIYDATIEPGFGFDGAGIPLIFQDKVFWDPAVDPTYNVSGALGGGGVVDARAGDLWYPYLYEKALWKVSKAKKAFTPPIPSAIPEFFGDTMLVNGTVYPFLEVQQGRYRFRLLNACNARFLNLQFVVEDPAFPGEPILVKGLPQVAPVNVWQVGTEGGFLQQAVQLFSNGLPVGPVTNPPTLPLLVGPAERPDIVVDFTNVPAGTGVLLYNDAAAPYPGGGAAYDWYFGSKRTAVVTQPGFGPNTRTPLLFRVGAFGPVPNAAAFNPTAPMLPPNQLLPTVPDALNGGLKLNIPGGGTWTSADGTLYTYVPTTQELTLNESFDGSGRLMQLVGTTVPVAGGFGRTYLDFPTEMVTYGTIQIWNVYNLTADAHPMHVHLFNAMVLGRRPFNVSNFKGIPNWTGLGRGPDPAETGWKETFKMYPGECTTIAILVEHPLPTAEGYARQAGTGRPVIPAAKLGTSVDATLPPSPRLHALGIANADEYVWHCHILEHEEHDMMRPLVAK